VGGAAAGSGTAYQINKKPAAFTAGFYETAAFYFFAALAALPFLGFVSPCFLRWRFTVAMDTPSLAAMAFAVIPDCRIDESCSFVAVNLARGPRLRAPAALPFKAAPWALRGLPRRPRRTPTEAPPLESVSIVLMMFARRETPSALKMPKLTRT